MASNSFGLERNGIKISATNPIDEVIIIQAFEQQTERVWEKRISDISSETNNLCPTPKFFFNRLIIAASPDEKYKNHTLSITKKEASADWFYCNIFIQVTQQETELEPQKEFVLKLEEVVEPVEKLTVTVEKLKKEIYFLKNEITTLQQRSNKKDIFCFENECCHSHLRLSYDKRVLRKLEKQNSHDICATGIALQEPTYDGRGEGMEGGLIYYWCLRVIRLPTPFLSVGVLTESGKGGISGFTSPKGLSGVSLYGSGNVFQSSTKQIKKDATEWSVGTVVGVLVDMEKRTVRFEVNCVMGAEWALPEGNLYFFSSCHAADQSIEVLSERCSIN